VAEKDAPMSLAELDAWFASVDAMAETETAHGGKVSKATLAAGQAATRASNARRGRK
jgi:hypothetical protein